MTPCASTSSTTPTSFRARVLSRRPRPPRRRCLYSHSASSARRRVLEWMGVLGVRTPPRRWAPLRSDARSTSNPVHEALGPVHARRAMVVAHAAVRDRVRRLVTRGSAACSSRHRPPLLALPSLSGQSEGFDYTGSSESLSTGVELGAGAWQAGLVASFTRTDLHYRAGAGLSEHGYLAGEHNTRNPGPASLRRVARLVGRTSLGVARRWNG